MYIVKNALVCFFLLILMSAQAKIAETPFTEYTYNPKTCQGIRHASGSQIFIPDNAFVLKKNGQICGENIKIKYREFHSQADMVANNIPMNFLQEKKNKQLESGGMFQILAECNGQDLELAKGKQIQVRFASKNDLDNLDAFYFDAKKGWQLLNTPVTDFSVRNTRQNAELWGNVPPQTNIGSATSGNIEMVSIQVNPDDPYTTLDSVILVSNMRLPGIFKGMNVEKMGLYNYDRILCDTESVHFAANFKLKGSEEKIASTVFVAYKDINSVIYYYPADWPERFALLPRKDLKIFTMLKDGRIAIFPPKEIEKLDMQSIKNKQYTFELEVVEGAPQNKLQLAQKTGINY